MESVKSILRNNPEYPFFIASVSGPFSHFIIFLSLLSEEIGINLPIKSPIVVSSVKWKIKLFSGSLEYLVIMDLAIKVIPTPSFPVNKICFPFEIAISAYLSTSLKELDGKQFKYLEVHRDEYAIGGDNNYTFPGAIQYYGDNNVFETTT